MVKEGSNLGTIKGKFSSPVISSFLVIAFLWTGLQNPDRGSTNLRLVIHDASSLAPLTKKNSSMPPPLHAYVNLVLCSFVSLIIGDVSIAFYHAFRNSDPVRHPHLNLIVYLSNIFSSHSYHSLFHLL